MELIFDLAGLEKYLISFVDMDMTRLRNENKGEAYVIMNIRIPESIDEWLEIP